MKKNSKDCRINIANAIMKYAKEQKIGIDRAVRRAQNSKRFEGVITNYAKSKRISVERAWTRVINAVSNM